VSSQLEDVGGKWDRTFFQATKTVKIGTNQYHFRNSRGCDGMVNARVKLVQVSSPAPSEQGGC
jgi:hypothetical protein